MNIGIASFMKQDAKITHMTACDVTDFPYEKLGAPSGDSVIYGAPEFLDKRKALFDDPGLLRNMAPRGNEG